MGLVQLLVSLDLSVVNLGLPRIADGLGFVGPGLTWVVHAYALAFGGLLLLGGKLADRLGRRRLLLGGLALFALASLAGGLATAPWHLVAARAAQGVGAAALAPAALAVLTVTFPTGPARVRAFGVWSAMNAAGGALGVLVGGVLTEHAGWRWVMWVNVPLALGALLLAARGVRRDRPDPAGGRPDVAGALLGTAGVTSLVLAVVGAAQRSSTATFGLLALAAVLLTLFTVIERTTARDPLVPPALLRLRTVVGANAFNLFLGAAMASAFYFLSLYLQDVLGHGPTRAGLMFLPFALGVVGGAAVAGRLGARVGSRTLLVAGGLATALGFLWFGRVGADGTFLVDVLGPSVLTSVGFGLCLGPVVSTATVGVAARHSGAASGLLSTSRQLGASVGLAGLGSVAATRAGASPDPTSLAAGLALGLTLCALLLGLAVLVAALVLPRAGTPAGDTSDEGSTPVQKHTPRAALAALWTGFGITCAALVVLHTVAAVPDRLAAHVRLAYPAYDSASVDRTVGAWMTVLTITGALGLVGWLLAIWTTRRGSPRAPWWVAGLFVVGTGLAAYLATVRDTSGDTGLPQAVGAAGLLPSAVGLVALVLVWRQVGTGRQEPARQPA
ncbi:MFS transporter [Ornithinimicrobium humiphilum]|uniref:MFS transporter n=1 Tax=Ornithinimicrobium humiphilum TaxID=125288 RepID=UPI00192D8A63|nr:MFS transporter [Ornithinimicrobium humiphilum]